MELRVKKGYTETVTTDTDFAKQMSDKGYLLTSAESVINWARTGSLRNQCQL